jgi:hypothetical protein
VRCERCQGTGKSKNRHYFEELPCPYCMGSGIAHCCDGLCEQPTTEDDK